MNKPKSVKKPEPTVPILLRLPKSMLADIDSIVAETKRSRAVQIRLMLGEWLDEKTEPA